jgi:hypothetical protein
MQILAPVMGALRALVQAWGSWCQDPEWTQEPFVDEEDESVQVLVELLSKSELSKGEQHLRLEAAAVLYHLCTHEWDLMDRAGEVGAVRVLVDVVNHNRQSRDVVWAVSALCVLVAHEPVQHVKRQLNSAAIQHYKTISTRVRGLRLESSQPTLSIHSAL